MKIKNFKISIIILIIMSIVLLFTLTGCTNNNNGNNIANDNGEIESKNEEDINKNGYEELDRKIPNDIDISVYNSSIESYTKGTQKAVYIRDLVNIIVNYNVQYEYNCKIEYNGKKYNTQKEQSELLTYFREHKDDDKTYTVEVDYEGNSYIMLVKII